MLKKIQGRSLKEIKQIYIYIYKKNRHHTDDINGGQLIGWQMKIFG